MNNNIHILDESKIELKHLKKEKGILSRKIGSAKKQSLQIDDLINKVKEVSKKISLINNKKQKLESNDKSKLNDDSDKDDIHPPQFSERCETESNSPLIINTKPDMVDWDSYVNDHPNSTIYHCYIFKTSVENVLGHTCQYISVERNKTIKGIIPLV